MSFQKRPTRIGGLPHLGVGGTETNVPDGVERVRISEERQSLQDSAGELRLIIMQLTQ